MLFLIKAKDSSAMLFLGFHHARQRPVCSPNPCGHAEAGSQTIAARRSHWPRAGRAGAMSRSPAALRLGPETGYRLSDSQHARPGLARACARLIDQRQYQIMLV